MKTPKQTIIVKGKQIALLKAEQSDYISLTDIVRYKNPHEPKDIIKNWLRAKSAIEFLASGNKFISLLQRGRIRPLCEGGGE